MEQAATPTALVYEIGRLLEMVESSDDLNWLREEFLIWLKRVILPRRFPEAKLRELRDLEELRTMLEETVEGWTREWEAQGYRKGLEAGLDAGREQGLEAGREQGLEAGRKVLSRMLELRFGPLEESTRAKIATAKADEIEEWSRRALDAETVEAVFAGGSPAKS